MILVLLEQKYYVMPREYEAPRWVSPCEFSPEDINIIKFLIKIGHQYLEDNKETCPWPERADDILKEVDRLTACIPFGVLLSAEEYEALYALLTLALQVAQQPAYQSLSFIFDMEDKEKGKVPRLLQKVIENMERLRKQETLNHSN